MVSNFIISLEIPCTVLKAWAAECQTVPMDSFKIRTILSKIRNFLPKVLSTWTSTEVILAATLLNHNNISP